MAFPEPDRFSDPAFGSRADAEPETVPDGRKYAVFDIRPGATQSADAPRHGGRWGDAILLADQGEGRLARRTT